LKMRPRHGGDYLGALEHLEHHPQTCRAARTSYLHSPTRWVKGAARRLR
jgi:hypothetical protein